MKFEYHPDVDALYIRLNPGREPKGQGGDTVVIGDGIVLDVDAEGQPQTGKLATTGWQIDRFVYETYS